MVKIGHLTDLHVQDWSDFHLCDVFTKRLTGFANYKFFRGSHHKNGVLALAVEKLVLAAPDLVIVTGDLSNVGFRSEWKAAKRLLRPLENAGIALRVIPGNHDYYVHQSASGRFESYFRKWQSGKEYPQVARSGAVSCILLNSARVTPLFTAFGAIDPAQRERFVEMCESERAAGQRLLVALHHHLTPAPHKRYDGLRELKGATSFLDLITQMKPDLVIHGHNHFAQLQRLKSGITIQGLSSSSSDRTDLAERRGQIGLYSFDQNGLQSIEISELSTGKFGDWMCQPL